MFLSLSLSLSVFIVYSYISLLTLFLCVGKPVRMAIPLPTADLQDGLALPHGGHVLPSQCRPAAPHHVDVSQVTTCIFFFDIVKYRVWTVEVSKVTLCIFIFDVVKYRVFKRFFKYTWLSQREIAHASFYKINMRQQDLLYVQYRVDGNCFFFDTILF